MNKQTSSGNSRDFTAWAHSFGRWGSGICLLYMLAIPVIICSVFHCWPSMSVLLKGAAGLLPIFVPVGISEALSYTPMLGSSCYLTFLTGNIMNMKLPCALNAQKVTGVNQNTPEGDAISIVAVATVSIITILVIAVGVIFLVPLQPVLQKPVVQTATKYIIPALMGSLFFGFFGKGDAEEVVENKLTCIILPLILCIAGVFMGKLNAGTQGYAILIMMPVTILCARILWKRGVIRVVKNPNKQPQANASQDAQK